MIYFKCFHLDPVAAAVGFKVSTSNSNDPTGPIRDTEIEKKNKSKPYSWAGHGSMDPHVKSVNIPLNVCIYKIYLLFRIVKIRIWPVNRIVYIKI